MKGFIIQIPILLIAIPLAVAFLIPLFNLFLKRFTKFFTLITSFINLILSVYLTNYLYITHDVIRYSIGNFKPPFGIQLQVNLLIGLLLTLLNIILFFVSIYYVSDKNLKIKDNYGYIIATLGIIASSNALLMSADLFNLFVFLEVLTISALIIATSDREKGYLGSFNFLIYSSIGAVFFLLGVLSIYSHNGSLYLFNKIVTPASKNFLLSIGIIFFIALGVEAKFFPFSGWIPSVYKGATSITALIFSVAIALSSLIVSFKIFAYQNLTSVKDLFILFGLITIVAGEISALTSTDLRVIFGYSSMAQAGVLFSAFVIGGTTSRYVIPQLFQIMLAKSAIFFSIYNIGIFDLNKLKGNYKKDPVSSLSLAIGGLSLAGMPLFFGFLTKLSLLKTIFFQRYFLVFAVILGASVIEIFYIFRIIQKLYFKDHSDKHLNNEKNKFRFNPLSLIPLTIAIFLLIAGIYPELIKKIFNVLLRGGF